MVNHVDYCEAMAGQFITVEGNIGVGKTTFCKRIAGMFEKSTVIYEPVDNKKFKELLGLYYSDPKRWAFTFQMYALKARFEQHTFAAELVHNGYTVIQDRSIYADGCFGMLNYENGTMTELEWSIYCDTFGAMKRYLRYPDLMIFLDANPETCLGRIKLRGREEEVNVSVDYLTKLSYKHYMLASSMRRYTEVAEFLWESSSPNYSEVEQTIKARLAAIHPMKKDGRSLKDGYDVNFWRL